VTDEFWIQTIRSAPDHWLVEQVASANRLLAEVNAHWLQKHAPEGKFPGLHLLIAKTEGDLRHMTDELARRRRSS